MPPKIKKPKSTTPQTALYEVISLQGSKVRESPSDSATVYGALPPGHVVETHTVAPERGWIKLSQRTGSMSSWLDTKDGSIRRVSGAALDDAIDRLLAPGLELVTVGTKRELLRDLTGKAEPDGDYDDDTPVSDPARAAAEAEARGDAARCQASGSSAAGGAGDAAAISHYQHAVRILARAAPSQYDAEQAARVCCSLAACHMGRRQWWETFLSASCALVASAGRIHEMTPLGCLGRYQRAAAGAKLGLLSRARDEMQALLADPVLQRVAADEARATLPGPLPSVQALASELRAVEARLSAIDTSDAELRLFGTALADRAALGDLALASTEEALRVGGVVAKLCRVPHGRAALVSDGMLDDDSEPTGGEAGLKRTARRATYRSCTYHANMVISNVLSLRARAGTAIGRPTDHTLPPARACRPDAPSLLSSRALETLRTERLVVIDSAVDAATISAAARELKGMQQRGVLWADKSDLCAPRTQRHNLLLDAGSLDPQLGAECPALTRCVEALCGIPLLLEKALGLELRVPQTVMCTCMPAGASYKEHIDSDRGKDNPRLVTVLLYLAYDPPKAGALRVHNSNRPEGGGGTRDIFPHPGRLVVFFAQEKRHEVLASAGERFAMTLWIWQTARDEAGR